MTRDSGRHAQRGDVQQAPSEGCQSVIAQRIPSMPSPPIGTDEELIELLRAGAIASSASFEIRRAMSEAADALQSRIAEVERLEEALNRLHSTAQLVFNRGAVTGPQWTKLGMEMTLARAALSQHRTRDSHAAS